MKIFLICPVRNLTKTEKVLIQKHVENQELGGHQVHWPPRDTDQNDQVGLRICEDNRNAIENADEIHIWWNGESEGSKFDFGMVFALRKKVLLLNHEMVKPTPGKSFANVLLTFAKKYERITPQL